MKISGIVKWYDSTKGYGFIKVEGRDKDVFFHAKNWNPVGKGQLPVEGEKLTFIESMGPKGLFAESISREMPKG